MVRLLLVVLLAYCLQLVSAGDSLAKESSTEHKLLQSTELPAQIESETTFVERVTAMSTTMRVFASLAGVFAALSGVWYLGLSLTDLAKYLKRFPLVVYEVLLYAISFVLLIWGTRMEGTMRNPVAMTGCALLLASAMFTVRVRKLGDFYSQVSFGLFLVWAVVAVTYNNSWIGAFAIAALFSAIGFSVLITPLCYYIGFRDDKAVGRTTTAAFAILLVFIALRLMRTNIPQLTVFDSGAIFLGAFVGYLGLLIASSAWYSGRSYPYWVMQVITILALIAAILGGTFLQIGELQKIGGTFFVLYLLEKPFELARKSLRTWVGIFFLVSVICFGLAMIYGVFEDQLSRFLFLPGEW